MSDTYVRHSDGLRPDRTHPRPLPSTSLQGFLGMANYLGKFIPNLSEISAPLRQLTDKDTAWSWYSQHQRAFDGFCLHEIQGLDFWQVHDC